MKNEEVEEDVCSNNQQVSSDLNPAGSGLLLYVMLC